MVGPRGLTDSTDHGHFDDSEGIASGNLDVARTKVTGDGRTSLWPAQRRNRRAQDPRHPALGNFGHWQIERFATLSIGYGFPLRACNPALSIESHEGVDLDRNHDGHENEGDQR